MNRTISLAGLVLLLGVIGGPARGEEKAPATREQLQRLVTVCKVWGTIRYQHPFLAYQDIDWDAALVKALPKVEAAKTNEEFAAAVQVMLDALRDPATRTRRWPPDVKSDDSKGKAKSAERKLFTQLEDGVLVLNLRNWPERFQLGRDPKSADEFRTQVRKASAVIVDCRENPFIDPTTQRLLEELLCSREIKGIGRRAVMHSGYRPQSFA